MSQFDVSTIFSFLCLLVLLIVRT